MSTPIFFRFVLGTSAAVAAISTVRIADSIKYSAIYGKQSLDEIKSSVADMKPPFTQALKKYNDRKSWF
jgi:hypothetical protein